MAILLQILKVMMITVAIVPWFSRAMGDHHLQQVAAKYNLTCILVFGDSSVDAGNNNVLQTTRKSNFPPYGKDFFNSTPTGRFSDGRLTTDFNAEALGYKQIIPAYPDPNLKLADLPYGVSFASAATGYDDLTANLSMMHRLGASRVGIVGVPPMGCIPLTKTMMKQKDCVASMNQVAYSFNAKVQQQLNNLKAKLVLVGSYVDAYAVIQSAVANSQA